MSSEGNDGKVIAVVKRKRSYAFNTCRDRHLFQTGAFSECMAFNARKKRFLLIIAFLFICPIDLF